MSIEEQKAAQAVDVLAVMDCLVDLARHRLTMKRRDFDRKVVAGKRPHYDVEIKADRADYIFQQGREARAAVAELIERDRTAGYTHEDVMRLVEAGETFFDTQCALDNHECAGPNATSYDVLMRARNAARSDFEEVLAPFTHQAKDGSR